MKVAHIGIAVKCIEARLAVWRDGLGLKLLYVRDVPDQNVRVAVLDCNGVHIELLEALGDQSPIHSFIEKRGEGLHHLCVEVENISKVLSHLAANGATLIDEEPRIGASGKKIAFVHPGNLGGVLVELTEP